MAKESGKEKSLHELRQEVAHSRDRLARDLAGLRYELDFPLKFRRSFQRSTAVWVAAAVVLGVLVAMAPARKKKAKVKAKTRCKSENEKEGILGAGLALGALKLAATLLKPVVVKFVSQKMSGYAAGTGADRRRS
jgi:hypothetical protein